MQSSVRKSLVFALILAIHGAAVFALASARPRSPLSAAETPVSVRFIEMPESLARPSSSDPLEVRTISPTIHIPLPDTIVDLSTVPESTHAISVAERISTQRAAEDDRRTPALISTVEYLREPVLRYPPQSRRLKEEGLVMLRVLIDEQGHACSIEIERSSGHARLDHAAREAVERAAFRPYLEDGTPRRAFVLIPIEFSLNRNSA